MASPLPRLAALFVFLLALSAAWAADASFAAATEAFTRGDFARALELFEAVAAEGAQGPAVPYNIGVCRYKLGRYAEAEADFAALGARFPQMRAVAEYNRGLALLELDREAEARSAFAAARDGADVTISRLATTALARLDEPAAAPAASPKWFGLFEAAAGHDGNVALLDELSLPEGESADSPLLSVFGYAGRSFGERVPKRLDLSVYAIDYADVPQFDQTQLAAAVAFELGRGAWIFELGPRFDYSTLDGDGLELDLGVSATAYRAVGERMRFSAFAAFDDVSAPDSQFDYLEGARRRIGAAIGPRGASTSGFRAAVVRENSDRAAASVTSDRDRVELGYRYGVARWLLDARVSRRTSRYDDAAGRREELTELGAAARRNLGHGWRFSAEYRRSDNDSDVAEFSYDADRFALGVGRVF